MKRKNRLVILVITIFFNSCLPIIDREYPFYSIHNNSRNKIRICIYKSNKIEADFLKDKSLVVAIGDTVKPYLNEIAFRHVFYEKEAVLSILNEDSIQYYSLKKVSITTLIKKSIILQRRVTLDNINSTDTIEIK